MLRSKKIQFKLDHNPNIFEKLVGGGYVFLGRSPDNNMIQFKFV